MKKSIFSGLFIALLVAVFACLLTVGRPFASGDMGKFPFTLGNAQCELTVVAYEKPQYREVTAKEASELIKSIDPLILDVRTSEEYNSGHLKDAILIPVQKLRKRIAEIEKYKKDPILVYCATGNRSTVASKILIDKGFTQIYNLIEGFRGWANKGYPVER